MASIKVIKEFTDAPGVRYRNQSRYSGEEFREDFLVPKYLESIQRNEKLIIDLDGGYGYPPSFLEEAFGGLARKYLKEKKKILDTLEFISEDQPGLEEKIREFMAEA